MSKAQSNTREATKQEDAVRRVQELAARLGPGAQLPKFLTLRDELGVSGTTLTAALTDLERQGVIVRKHGVGIYVSERLHHRNIVLLCSPAFFQGEVSPFWEMLVRHARERATEKSEDLTLHFARTLEEPYPKPLPSTLPEPLVAEIEAQRVHGVLGVGLKAWTAEEVMGRGLPYVAFAGYGKCAVAFDDTATVRIGVEALAKAGCRRIALWSAVSPHRPLCREEVLRRPAIALFQQAVTAAGLAYDPALVRTNAHLCPDVVAECTLPDFAIPSQQEQGRRTVLEVFGPGADPRLRPDGIVCAEDVMTQGALPQLVQFGLRPGVDVRIATHSNAGSPTLFGYEDALIRIEANPADLVREMYDLLETQMAGETPANPQRCLEPSLILPATRP